ncbi:MAG: hypothetical protein KDB79_15145 [Acidobacteria bacterium]|nr:hypothetical protein [Acidobacteriota bacterium]
MANKTTSDPNRELPIARNNDLAIQDTQDEILIYDLNTNKAHCFNSTAAKIWRNCDGVSKISDLARNSKIPLEIIYIALDQFQNNNLLRSQIETPVPAEKLERRKFLIHAAAISTIALPLVSTIVAPQAIFAQSCLPGGTPIADISTTQTSQPVCQNYCQTTPAPGCCVATTTIFYSFNSNTNECLCGYANGCSFNNT